MPPTPLRANQAQRDRRAKNAHVLRLLFCLLLANEYERLTSLPFVVAQQQQFVLDGRRELVEVVGGAADELVDNDERLPRRSRGVE